MNNLLNDYHGFPSKSILDISPVISDLSCFISSTSPQDLSVFCKSFLTSVQELKIKIKLPQKYSEAVIHSTMEFLNTQTTILNHLTEVLSVLKLLNDEIDCLKTWDSVKILLFASTSFSEPDRDLALQTCESIYKQRSDKFFQLKLLDDLFSEIINCTDIKTQTFTPISSQLSSLYLSIIQLLSKLIPLYKKQVTEFILINLDPIKLGFILTQSIQKSSNSPLQAITMQSMIFLLSNFINDETLDFFIPLFILLALEHDLICRSTIKEVLEFLLKCIDGKYVLKDSCIVSLIFSWEFFIGAWDRGCEEVWVKIWSKLLEVMSIKEICLQLMIVVEKVEDSKYFKCFLDAILRFEVEFKEILDEIVAAGFVERVFRIAEIVSAKGEDIKVMVDLIRNILVRVAKERWEWNVVLLVFQGNLRLNSYFQKNCMFIIPQAMKGKHAFNAAKEFLEGIEKANDANLIYRVFNEINSDLSEELQVFLVSNNFFEIIFKILSSTLLNFNMKKASKVWISALQMIKRFPGCINKIGQRGFYIFALTELRKDAYNECRGFIIENTIENLIDLYECNPKNASELYLLILELVSYNYDSNRFIRAKNQVFLWFSVKKLCYKNLNKIADILLFHYLSIREAYWNSYRKMLEKCFRCKISSKNMLKVCELLKYPRLSCELLRVFCNIIDLNYPIANTLKRYLVFNNESYYAYISKDVIFKFKTEFSAMFWIKPAKSCSDCVILELGDTLSSKILIIIRNDKVVLEGITSKSIFQCESSSKIIKGQWNFISVTVLLNKKPLVSILILQNWPDSFTQEQIKLNPCKIQGKAAFNADIKSIFLGSSAHKSEAFQGKIASAVICKRLFTDTEIKVLYETPYIKNIYGYVNNEPEALTLLKPDLVFILVPEQKHPLAHSQDFNLSCKYTKFIGNSLIESLKAAKGLNSFRIINLKTSEFSIFLELCKNLCIFPQFTEILGDHGMELISYQASNLKIAGKARKNMISFITNVTNPKIKKEFVYYYIVTGTHYDTTTDSLEDLDAVVEIFKDTYGFSCDSVLLLCHLLKSAESIQFSYIFRHFIKQISNRAVLATVIPVLIKAEEFLVLESILSLITYCSFEGISDEFLDVMTIVLMYPVKSSVHCCALKIIYAEVSRLLNNTKGSEKIFLGIFSFISERFTGVDALIDCLMYFNINSNFYNLKVKKEFLDIVLDKTKYLRSAEYSSKLIKYLKENLKYTQDFIFTSELFPTWLVCLYQASESIGYQIANLVFLHFTNLSSLCKISEFFARINYSKASFGLIKDLFYDCIERKVIKEWILEFLGILDGFELENANDYIILDMVEKLVDASIESKAVLSLPILISELNPNELQRFRETNPNKHVLRVLIVVLAKFSVERPDFLIKNLQKIIDYTGWFKCFTASQEDRTKAEITLKIFIFALLSELIYSRNNSYIDFFNKFIKSVNILSTLTIFFTEISYEKLQYCTRYFREIGVISFSNQYLQEIHKSFIIITPDKAIAQLSQANTSNILDIIFDSEWIVNIHYVISVLIFFPIKSIKDLFRHKQRLNRPIELHSNILNRFEKIIQDCKLSDIQQKRQKSLKYLRYNAEMHRKQNIIHSSIDLQSDLKFTIKNQADSYGRRALLKQSMKVSLRSLMGSKLERNESDAVTDIESNIVLAQRTYEYRKSRDKKSDCNRFKCEQIKVTGSFYGSITIDELFLEFECKGKAKKQYFYIGSALESTIGTKSCHYIWKVDEIREVLGRRFIHNNSAIEIFFKKGKSYFFNLFSKKMRKKAFTLMKSWDTVKVYEKIPRNLIAKYMEKWCSRKISTLRYLLILNKYSGRTFNDISQYPIFPWLIKDFTQEKLDIEDPEVYRNFSYPIGAQSASARSSLIKSTCDLYPNNQYTFSYYYSNTSTPLYYLSRLEPYNAQSKLLIPNSSELQFSSMNSAWESSKFISGDHRELIPEMFYLPDAFENLNNSDANSFDLPKWAMNSWDFVRIHQMCLESNYTSMNLNHWIDMVFGVKQHGESAEKSSHLYHPICYKKTYKKIAKQTDLYRSSAVIEQAYSSGQIPQQVFKELHGTRKPQPETFFESLKKGVGISKKLVKVAKGAEFLSILNESDKLFVFFAADNIIHFSRYDITDKNLTLVKDSQLQQSVFSNFKEILLDLWRSLIVSSGYLDFSTRLHTYDGLLSASIYYSPCITTSIHAGTYLYTCGFNIFQWNLQYKLKRTYSGHSKEIKSISVSSSLNIIASSDCYGLVIIHHFITCECMFSINIFASSVNISQLGLVVLSADDGFKVYSINGVLLWGYEVFMPREAKLNCFGNILVYWRNNELQISDFYERKNFVYKVEGVSGFSIGSNEKSIFAARVECEYIEIVRIEANT